MHIPIRNLLKRQAQARLAELQDEVVDAMYRLCPNAVLHGGTAIWRCFQGVRFSEDLDFYAMPEKDFRQELEAELKKRALLLSKFKQTENVVFAKVSNGIAECSLEISKRKSPESIPASFEKADGSSIEVFTLSIEGLASEKANAFSNRRLARDLHDVFFLLPKAKDLEKTKPALEGMILRFKEPADEKNLKAIIYSGAVPSARQMLEKIKKVAGL